MTRMPGCDWIIACTCVPDDSSRVPARCLFCVRPMRNVSLLALLSPQVAFLLLQFFFFSKRFLRVQRLANFSRVCTCVREVCSTIFVFLSLGTKTDAQIAAFLVEIKYELNKPHLRREKLFFFSNFVLLSQRSHNFSSVCASFISITSMLFVLSSFYPSLFLNSHHLSTPTLSLSQ